jgi:hypothetical protein
MAIVSGSAFAEGSRISNSTLTNSANNQGATTRATGGFGGGGQANTGSIVVQDGSRVSNSTLNNSANNRNSTTTAEGGMSGGKANTGSIVIKD